MIEKTRERTWSSPDMLPIEFISFLRVNRTWSSEGSSFVGPGSYYECTHNLVTFEMDFSWLNICILGGMGTEKYRSTDLVYGTYALMGRLVVYWQK